MATRDDEVYYKALSLLDCGEDPKVVADKLEVSYASVLRWKREFATARENGSLSKLIDLDKLIIEAVANQIAAPADALGLAAKRVASKVDGLQALQESFRLTAEALNLQIKSRAMSIDHVSELTELTNSLCALQNAFFNKNMTQVNIQNNLTDPDGKKYGTFLSDVPND